jgi:hypothetical protein
MEAAAQTFSATEPSLVSGFWHRSTWFCGACTVSIVTHHCSDKANLISFSLSVSVLFSFY